MSQRTCNSCLPRRLGGGEKFIDGFAGLTPRRDGGYSRRVNHSVAILFLASAAAWAQTANNPPDPEAAAGGGAAFRPYCTPCHGVRGEGGPGAALARGVYSVSDR